MVYIIYKFVVRLISW